MTKGARSKLGVSTLARVQTSSSLILNACGTMIGTGIYTMTGQMAGETGNATVFAFAIGAIPALLVGMVYAGLATRYPRANSLSHWLHEAFGVDFLSFLGGSATVVLYMFAGTATSQGLVLTFCKWMGLGETYEVVGCVCLLVLCCCLCLRGLEDASRVLAICTFIEIAGLAVIIFAVAFTPTARSTLYSMDWFALPHAPSPPSPPPSPPGSPSTWDWFSTVIPGGVFVLFSFGGFETIASQAEETEAPEQVLPLVFGVSLAMVALLNVLVIGASLSVIDPLRLADSPDPLTDVMEIVVPGLPREVFTLILLASAFNSVLGIQIHISRTLWGMACDGQLPACLTQTRHFGSMPEPQPHVALAVTTAAMVALLVFGLADLGRNCATLLIISFLFAHASFLRILCRERTQPVPNVFTVGQWVPIGGIACTLFILYFALAKWGWHFVAGWFAVSASVFFLHKLTKAHVHTA